MQSETIDVAVVGAGVAGLAAARELRAAGLRVVVLEARERIGGRVFTVRDPALGVPIELGAEFLHGPAEETREIARAARLTPYDMAGLRVRSTGGRLRVVRDFWRRLDLVMRRLDAERDPDRSFADFLARRPGGRALADERRLAAQFVAGFHAAPLDRISERALAAGGSPRGEVRERRIGRLLEGYSALADWLASAVADRIRLGAVVRRVAWGAGEVALDVARPDGSSSGTVVARAAIVAVPAGVLQAHAEEPGAIAFDPPLAAKREPLAGVAMGSVVRVALRLREPFWEAERFAEARGVPGLDQLAFVHGDDEWFPVCWTSYPLRTPLVVAWSGGAAARALGGRPVGEIEALAARAVARQLGLPARRGESIVDGAWTHDWQHDPFARGAYSYQTVGGADAPRALARPLRRTLWLAGEASEPSGRTGTVDGAIATGRRAAREVTRALGA